MPRILIVEDNEVNRVMLGRRLEQRGYQISQAETGEACLELVVTERPDLIIMDLGLPGIDGWETTRRLKADPETQPIPVIALSAHAHSSDRERAMEAGCIEFEPKPVQLPVLLQKIEAALSNTSVAAVPVAVTQQKVESKPVAPAKVENADSICVELSVSPPVIASPGSITAVVRNTPRTPAIAPPEAKEIVPVERKHILVVEDNDPNRVMLCRRLQRQGFVTSEARDGREALELVRGPQKFDLMLLDIMMPEVDGYQVLAELKGSPDLKALPVIMISAIDEMASIVRCIEMGAEDYLPKPYDPVLLQARVNASLDKRRIRDKEMDFFRAVAAVTDAAAALEDGKFDPSTLIAVSARVDELGRLARVFQKMAENVKVREQTLRQEVERLKVEIDESRKSEQVAEITETSYFQQLQVKAADLRRRYRRGSGITAITE